MMRAQPAVQTVADRALDCAIYLFVGLALASLLRLCVGCGGDAFVLEHDGGSLVLEHDGGSLVGLGAQDGALSTIDRRAPDADVRVVADSGVPLFVDAPADAPPGNEAASDRPSNDAQGDGEAHSSDASADAALACDPAYGDASPGGPCCVHVWADSAHTLGAVLCTLDGSRWCEQSGAPCSAPGSRCVVQSGVSYCAP